MSPCRQTLSRQRALLRSGEISAVELVRDHVRAMEQHRGLNMFITETVDHAMQAAARADAACGGIDAGPLSGIPLAIKDLYCTQGIRTTAASRILSSFVPPYESTVTQRLWQAGAVCLGKTSLDEFAMGSSNETSYFGPVGNPWRSKDQPEQVFSPGGSSGGSAAAVAACCAAGALGTDTGGSIRQPAAFCGVVGVKPTYGRCSRFGVVAFASSLDQPGPIARTVEDVAIMLDVICGFDTNDSTSAELAPPRCEAAFHGAAPKNMRVGLPKQCFLDGMDAKVVALWQQGADWLRAAGMEVHEVDLPMTVLSLPAYYIIAPAEASANLSRYDGVRFGFRAEGGADLTDMYELTRSQGFGAEVKRRLMIGTYVLSAGYYDAYYRKAQQVRSLIADEYNRVFNEVDLLLTPTAPAGAFPLHRVTENPVEMYLHDVFTAPVSLAGLPAISIPAGINGAGLPLGLQLIGQSFQEETLIQGARILEEAAGFAAMTEGIRP